MERKRKAITLILLLCLIGIGMAGWRYYQASLQAEKNALELHGNVDVREIAVAFRESDRIAELLVQEGDSVKKGELLARLDNEELKLNIQQTEAEVASLQAAADKLHNGSRSEDIAMARAELASARAAAENADGVYQRRLQIFESTGGISSQELDNARDDAQAKRAAVQASEAALQKAESGARIEDIQASDANLAAAKARLDRQQYLLAQTELRSPADGVIRSRLLEAGDMASPQSPVFKLSLLDKKWVRVYVSETALAKVYEGQRAVVRIDGSDRELEGQVGYIADTAEFTPKTVQTEELRTSLVYEVRIYVDDQDNILRLGMPATASLSL